MLPPIVISLPEQWPMVMITESDKSGSGPFTANIAESRCKSPLYSRLLLWGVVGIGRILI